jgi:hypothetical protein
MRRKPLSQGNGQSSGGYNNQHKKPRYQQGGSGGSHHNSGGNRPRKNYPAMREKYLAQARDAMASGDRVLAENYYQHADHCYRMMVEEGYNNRPQVVATQQQPEESQAQSSQEEIVPDNINQLPAFLTVNYDGSEQKAAEPAVSQNWEE